MKKLICLFLSLMIFISSSAVFAKEYLEPYDEMDRIFRFEVGEFVESDGTEEGNVITPSMKRIQFLDTLGIWDDVKKGENELLTLTEFSIIMARFRLGSSNSLEELYKANENKEIVTYRNAYAYLLESLGYMYKCNQYQNSDEGLLIVADQIGLLSERPDNIGAYISRGALAELIVKALTIDLSVIEYLDSGYRYTVTKGKNILNTIHGIYNMSGFVNAIDGLAVYGSPDLRDGFIQIERKNVYTNGLNLDKYLGALVSAYATLDENTGFYNIIYMDYDEAYQATEIDFKDIVEIRGGLLTYIGEDKAEHYVDIRNLSYVTENGRALQSLENMSDYRNNDGKIVLTESVKNNGIDTALVYVYNYFVAAFADNNQKCLGLNFMQRYNGLNFIQFGDKDIIKVNIDGKVSALEKMSAGMPFRMMRCENTGYTEIVATTTKMSGLITGVWDETVAINDIEYTLTKDLVKHIEYCKTATDIPSSQKVKEPVVGTSSTFYVFDKKIVCYTTAEEFKYGYLTDMRMERTGIDPNLTLRILTQDGEWIDFSITKAIEVDGISDVSKEELVSKINLSMQKLNKDEHIINNVIRYKAKSNDEIFALDTIEETNLEQSSDEDVKFEINHAYKYNYTHTYMGLSVPYVLSPATVIFVAPENAEDEKDYQVLKNTTLPVTTESSSLRMKLYNIDDLNQIKLAVLTETLESGGGGSMYNAPFFYVESIREVIIDEENFEVGYKIICKKMDSPGGKSQGRLIDASFIVTEGLLDQNTYDPSDERYDVTKRIDVGDIVRTNAPDGAKAEAWVMSMKGSNIGQLSAVGDDVSDWNELYGYQVAAKGKIVAIDTTNRLVIFESEGTEHPGFINLTAKVDPVTNKIKLVSVSEFNVGDIIHTYLSYGLMKYMVKN